MSPMQVIQASTLTAAEVCELGDMLGSLEPGKIADMIVVEGDPLADIHALDQVILVMRDGVVVRSDLE